MRLIISPTKVNKLLIWLNFNRYLYALLDRSPRCFYLLIPLSAEQTMHPTLLLGKVCLPAVLWLGRLRAHTSIVTTPLLQAIPWDTCVGHCPLPSCSAQVRWARVQIQTEPCFEWWRSRSLCRAKVFRRMYHLSCQGCWRLQPLHLHARAPGRGTLPARMEMSCLDSKFFMQ